MKDRLRVLAVFREVCEEAQVNNKVHVIYRDRAESFRDLMQNKISANEGKEYEI